MHNRAVAASVIRTSGAGSGGNQRRDIADIQVLCLFHKRETPDVAIGVPETGGRDLNPISRFRSAVLPLDDLQGRIKLKKPNRTKKMAQQCSCTYFHGEEIDSRRGARDIELSLELS